MCKIADKSREQLIAQIDKLEAKIQKLEESAAHPINVTGIDADLFETNQAIKLIIDPQTGAILEANSAACDYYGYTREKLLSMSIIELNTLSAREIKAQMKKARSKDQLNFLFQHQLSGSEIRDVEVFSGPVMFNGKEALYSIIHDVTEKNTALREMQLLANSTTDLLNLNSIDEIYEYSVNKLYEFLEGKCILTLVEYSSEADKWQMKHIKGLGHKLSELSKLLGFDPMKLTGKLNTSFYQKVKSGRLEELKLNLPTLLENRISSSIGKAIKRLLALDNLYTISFRQQDNIFGNISIITQKRCKKLNVSLIETYIDQISMVIQKKLSETKLRNSEEKFRTLFQTSPDGIAINNADGTYIDVNKKYSEMLGYSLDELKKLTFSDLTPQRWHEPEKKQLEILIKDGFHHYQKEYRRKDGSVFPVAVTGWKISDHNGKIKHWGGFFQDITQRQKAEEKLKQSEEKYRVISENAKHLILTHDINNVITYANKFAQDYFHLSKDEIIGKNITDFIQTDKDIAAMRNRLQQYFAGGKAFHHFEIEIKTASENYRTLELYGNPIVENGEFQSILLVGYDITERKQAEAALKESENRLLEAQAISHLGSWEYLLEDDSVIWSKELYNIFEYPHDLAAPKFSEQRPFYTAASYAKLDKALQACVMDEKPYEIELDIITARGAIKHIISKGNAKKNQANQVIGSYGTAQDITERKKAEQQIEQDLKEKNLLIQEIYHRTKNNLAVISALLSMQSRRSQDLAVKSTFREINNKIKAISLVQEKLYQAQDLSNIYMDDYIKDLAALMMKSYVRLIDKVDLKLDLQKVTVSIDAAVPLGLILNELVSNAFKHAFPQRQTGKIIIGLYLEKDHSIRLIIKDNGIGLPESFDPRKDGSMGMTSVFSLVEKQLLGEVLVTKNDGLSWQIIISDENFKERI